MDYLRGFPATAPLVRMILVITRDVGPFLGVCSIVIVGCTCFFAINAPEASSEFGNFDGVVGFLAPLLKVVLATLGSYDIRDYTKKAAVAMFLFFAFFVILLMLNLLIAIMGDSYSMVKESELIEGLRERAKLIVEHELLFPWRQTYCRYLHIAEIAAEGSTIPTAWDGIGGRLKALKRDLTMTTIATTKEIQSVKNELRTDIQKIEEKLDAILEALDAK